MKHNVKGLEDNSQFKEIKMESKITAYRTVNSDKKLNSSFLLPSFYIAITLPNFSVNFFAFPFSISLNILILKWDKYHRRWNIEG